MKWRLGLIRDKTAEAPAPQQFPGVLCSLGLQALAHILPQGPSQPHPASLPVCPPGPGTVPLHGRCP